MAKNKKTTVREIAQEGAAPVVETVTEIFEDVTREANETAGTILVKRWQVAVAAVVVTVLIIGVTL